jgi:hypothetical protein
LLGLPFEEAACAVDLAVLLPGVARESAVASAAIEAARETLIRLWAAPFLARLDQASMTVARPPVPATGREPGVSRDATTAGSATG